MRKFIIDTDIGSDDAAALIMAMSAPDIQILGITTIGGNIPLESTVKNALQVVEECKKEISVYPGAEKPLVRKLVTAGNVHGNDGMGDKGLIHPTRKAEEKHAVDFILDTIKENPDEVELIVLGPVTNIALAIIKDKETMSRVKHIWSMGTAGFGKGNMSPVAEFNVFVDAESYDIMLNSQIPITIAGFDLCLGDASFDTDELNELSKTPLGKFITDCNSTRLEFNKELTGIPYVDLPDAVAMAATLYEDVVTEKINAYCYCCTKEEATYGQVIIYDITKPYTVNYNIPKTNTTVIKSININKFKSYLKEALK